MNSESLSHHVAPEVVHDVVLVSSTELKVDTSGKKTYEWEDHGLKLELPSETDASFNLKTVSCGNYELPKEFEQLSPVYTMETKGELGGPVGLELQHCAEVKEEGQQLGMMFAVSKVEEGGSSSSFMLRDGQFSTGTTHGKVEVEFPNWRAAVVRRKNAVGPSPVFLASLYYQQLSPTMCLIHFIIVPKQDAWEKV